MVDRKENFKVTQTRGPTYNMPCTHSWMMREAKVSKSGFGTISTNTSEKEHSPSKSFRVLKTISTFLFNMGIRPTVLHTSHKLP